MVDWRHESGAKRSRVHVNDRGELEPFANFGQDRHAKLAASIEHEIDVLCGGLFGGADKVALVFAVGGVDHDHDLAAGDSVDGFLHGGILFCHDQMILAVCCEYGDG
jgi:hypothetical protein